MAAVQGLEKPTLDQLGEIAPTELRTVVVSGVNPATSYGYQLFFATADKPNSPHITISTEPRAAYLEKGTEASAEADLKDFSKRLRRLSGGLFHIHQLYGGVYGTRTSPLAPWILARPADPRDRLSTKILLKDDIGPTLGVDLNLEAQGIAADNDLDEAWTAEFWRMNGLERSISSVPPAMEVTPASITELLRNIGTQAIFDEVSIVAFQPK